MFDRKLLTKLSRCAWKVLNLYLTQAVPYKDAKAGELCPNLHKSSIPTQKITVDDKARFRYLDSYRFRLMDAWL